MIGELIDRIELNFYDTDPTKPIHKDLSAALFSDPQTLWVASDEMNAIERLNKIGDRIFANHQSFNLSELLDNFTDDDKEVDLEGMDYDGTYLWLIGSHSSKRKKAKVGKIERLKTIKRDNNRYLIARIPLIDNQLSKTVNNLHSACLKREPSGTNQLMESLINDPYFGNILTIDLPGKDNGFDIEGLLVSGDKILLGLRGPVLRGVTIILEISLQKEQPGILTLKSIGEAGENYKRHFLDLDGLGIRDLCRDGEDILILAGPTMDLDGDLRLFRWQNAFNLPDNSFTLQEKNTLEALFDIPHAKKSDRAEGLTMFPHSDSKAIMVVYDSPNAQRVIEPSCVLADVFRLD
jgi:hypothetical protein